MAIDFLSRPVVPEARDALLMAINSKASPIAS
jgi:hypothetical protein